MVDRPVLSPNEKDNSYHIRPAACKHNTTQHNTTQHNTTQHNTTQHNTTQQSKAKQTPSERERDTSWMIEQLDNGVRTKTIAIAITTIAIVMPRNCNEWSVQYKLQLGNITLHVVSNSLVEVTPCQCCLTS
jgi:hypothetical protein